MNRRDVPFDEAGFEKNRLDTVENVSLSILVPQKSNLKKTKIFF